MEETLVLLNNLVYLVQNVKQYLKIHQVQVFCRLVECLISGIVLQKEGIDYQDQSTILKNSREINPNEKTPANFELKDIPKEMSSLLKKQCGFVDDFIATKLRGCSIRNCSTSEWDRELCVSDL